MRIRLSRDVPVCTWFGMNKGAEFEASFNDSGEFHENIRFVVEVGDTRVGLMESEADVI